MEDLSLIHIWIGQLGVSGDLYDVLVDYLRGRWVEMRHVNLREGKIVTRGCPQGSVLGPQMWKIVFDTLIREMGEGFVGYADDGVGIVEAAGRRELEDITTQLIERLAIWCDRHKMMLSTEKTVGLMMKGHFSMNRTPRIRFGVRSLKMVNHVRYLGVTFDTGMRITRHVSDITQMAFEAVAGILRVAKNYSVSYSCLIKIYEGVYRAIVLYGVGAWGKLVRGRHRRKLVQGQRQVLVRITKAYRTISTNAVQVIAGVLPIDIELDKAIAASNLRNTGVTNWNGVIVAGRKCKRKLRTLAIRDWQDRWDRTETGLWTKAWFPRVKTRWMAKWICPGYYMTQALSGHGSFKWKLRMLGKDIDPSCRCGEIDTVGHILFGCVRWLRERESLALELRDSGYQESDDKELLMTEHCYGMFKKFVDKVLVAKELEDRTRALQGVRVNLVEVE